MILEVKGKGNFINRIDLFTIQNCEVLKKYITLKYLVKEKKINIAGKTVISLSKNSSKFFMGLNKFSSKKFVISKGKFFINKKKTIEEEI